LQGLSELGGRTISAWTPKHRQTDFPFEGLDSGGLLPGRRFELPHLMIASTAFVECEDPAGVTMFADVVVYVDDGLQPN
jgi:hypothetical protein